MFSKTNNTYIHVYVSDKLKGATSNGCIHLDISLVRQISPILPGKSLGKQTIQK